MNKINTILLTLNFIFILLTSPLYSQSDINQATRETDRLSQESEKAAEKLRKAPEEPVEIEIEKAPAIKGEEKFFIKVIKLEGCESFLPEEFSFILQKYENKEVSLSELENACQEIEQEYLRREIIAAVFVPPQEIKDQVVTLQVVEAKMGQLEIQPHSYFKKERLKYYWSMPEGEILRHDKIIKILQVMNKNPDRQVKSSLRAGKKTGTTDIILTPTTQFPMHISTTFDNEGSPSTGKSRFGLGARHNNFLGLDDMFLIGNSFGADFRGAYGYHSIPITPRGTTLMYGYSYSQSTPKKQYSSSQIYSEAANSTVSLHQDLYKKGDYIGEVSLGFDAKDKTIVTSSGVNNRDRLRIFTLGSSFVSYKPKSSLYIKPEFSQSIDGLGAKTRNALSSREANETFSKLNLEVSYKRDLPWQLKSILKFNGQICSTELTPQEEYYLGGIDSVRGYPAGDFLADTVFQGNAELLIPAFFIPANIKLPYDTKTLKEETTSLIFLDYGYGKKRNPSSSETASATLIGTGFGLRTKLFDKALVRMEWGFAAGDDSYTEEGESRFHLSVSMEL